MALTGLIAWVTGATSGIGRACALELAKRGATVAVSGRRREELATVVAEIERGGGSAFAVPCDVCRETDLALAVRTVVERFGRLDLVLANAGFAVMGTVRELSLDDWRRQLDTNVIGLVGTVKYALPELEKTRGRIGLVGSVSAFLASPKGAAYSASKAAVRAIGDTLSLELAGTGVTCTTVHPGFVESEIAKVDNRGELHADRKDRRPARLMWPADKAARVIVDALERRERELVFTGHGKVAAALARHTPGMLYGAMRLASGRRKKA